MGVAVAAAEKQSAADKADCAEKRILLLFVTDCVTNDWLFACVKTTFDLLESCTT